MTVLVTGGAGYVGSHMLLALKDAGEAAIALDDLSVGRKEQVPASVPLVVGNVGDRKRVAELLAEHAIEEVIHFAGSTLVRESIGRPLAYYRNNTANMIALLEACADAGVRRFIFSSSASVYGMPEYSPVPETAPLRPISPYGASMAMGERVLADAAAASHLSFATLRYFNVAGASPTGDLGEAHEPETHLIPNVICSALGTGNRLKVFGTDYPTRDGTCVRDYVHVMDLIEAHLLMLEKLQPGDRAIYNIGSEDGFSVMEVIRAAEKVVGKKIEYDMVLRREGDPATLVASSQKIRRDLGWKPRFPQMMEMMGHAFAWHSKHPNGYAAT